MDEYSDSPMRPVVDGWVRKIRAAEEAKRRRFGKEAELGMKFLNGPYTWLYDPESGESNKRHRPSFEMTLNKTAEIVQLFGPALYHRNPVRKVSPRRFPDVPAALFGPPDDPFAAQAAMQFGAQVQTGRSVDAARSVLLEAYLNATPNLLDLKTESRAAVNEALVKGMGTLWHEVYQSPGGGGKAVGSFYDTVDNLLIDPDAESLKNAQWIARRCCHPVWEVEAKYGLPTGTLKGSGESVNGQAEVDASEGGDYRRRIGKTNDLLTYWKVYSKMGVGGRLQGALAEQRAVLDSLGDFCLIVVAEGVPYPLNLPPALTSTPDDGEQVRMAVQWETPFWADGKWPFTPIAFHWIPRDPWPQSHLSPGMGELKFLNWAYSFIAGKLATTCRDFIVTRKSLGEAIEDQILSGRDLELIKLEEDHGTIGEVVQFLQHPTFNGDIWRVIEAVTQQFERRVGLTELMYGQSSVQLRSAAEADLKSGQLNVRPDDMANKVEDAMSAAARAEALAARWHLEPQDVAPVIGAAAVPLWEQLVYNANPGDIVQQLEYRVESGSARKPNRERDAANMNAAMQNLFQPLVQVCMATGNMGPVNALVREWGRTMDLDVDELGILFPAPPPPMPVPAGPGPGGPPPEGVAG